MLSACDVCELSTMQMSRRDMVVYGPTRNYGICCNDLQDKVVDSTTLSLLVFLLQRVVHADEVCGYLRGH
jgi:hypothetical protein